MKDQEERDFVQIPVYRTDAEQRALIRRFTAQQAKDVTPKDE